MSDEMIAPLFTHDEPGPQFPVGDLAKRLAEPGVTADYIAGQVRRWAKERIVQTRGKKGGGPTAQNLFSLGDAGVAKILSMLTEMGAMGGGDILRGAAMGLYCWRQGEIPVERYGPSPIWTVLAGTARGEHWSFRLNVLRSDQTGDQEVLSYVFRQPPEGEIPPVISQRGDDYMPRMTVTIPLILPFTRLLTDRNRVEWAN
jgi:hypothetical protein